MVQIIIITWQVDLTVKNLTDSQEKWLTKSVSFKEKIRPKDKIPQAYTFWK